MLYIKPDYFDTFACTADKCEDTCCAGWQIVIDEEALRRYRKFKGPYRRTLHKGICWHKKCFKQDSLKRCAFLNDRNLCDMYLACGDGIFCKTCDRYPRHIEEFEGVRETSLSVSCPEVARMLMSRKAPVKFLREETDEEETCKDFEEMDFDVLLYDLLSEGRDVLIAILQNRELALDFRLELSLHMAAEMQEALDDGAIFTCQDIFREYEEYAQHSKRPGFRRRRLKKENAMEYSRRVFNGLFSLERLREEWELSLTNSAAALYLAGEEAYQKATEEFEAWCLANASGSSLNLTVSYEQLAVYFIFTYFCGAVYNDNILVKVQASVLCIYAIEELLKAQWILNKGDLSQNEICRIVYHYSRELEHSDENLNRIEEIAEKLLPVRI